MYPTQKKSNMYDYRDGDIAAHHGYLELIMNNKKLHFTPNAINYAAAKGHLGVLKWFYKNEKMRSLKSTYHAIGEAAANGYLEVVIWLYENKRDDFICSHNIINNAARNGHLEILKWVHQNIKQICRSGCPIFITDAMDWASENG
jgi:hypothetical protein